MKRFALVAAVAALSIVGCKKSEEKKTEPAATTDTAAKPAEPTTPPATEPAATAPAADPAATAPAADPAAAAAGGEDLMSGIPECDDLVKKYQACEKIPAEAKNAALEGAKAWKAGAAAANAEGKAAIVESCKAAATAAAEAFKAAGC